MKKIFKNVVEKKIPAKNYYIVIIASILTVVIALLVRRVYLNYKENSIKSSVFNNNTITQINTDDFDFALNETPEAILYVSYTGDYEIYSIERKLYRDMKKKKLLDKVIYWNITNTKDYITLLQEKFPDIKSEITNAPLIVYIKNGEALEAISSELKTIDSVAFNKLVDKYEIK